MGKKLITIKNCCDYVCGQKFYVTKDMIITPGAKDKLRVEGIEVVYGEATPEIKETVGEDIKLEEKIVEILIKEFNITDFELIKKVIERLKTLF